MRIAAPVRKNLKAKALSEEHPELTPQEIGKLVGLPSQAVVAASKKERFGKDRPKSRLTT